MISYPPALRRSGFVAPRAIGQFGAAIAEARAAEARPPVVRARPPAVGAHAPRRRTVVRLWLPLTVLFLLLAPFALLLAPLLYLAPRRYGVNPLAAIVGVGEVLLSLGGTVIDVQARDALVQIKIF
ncbi:MAG: hypothetical protein ACHP7A_02035 [Caulobacterales bacterium]|jgi:hypothetical protein